MKTLPSKELLSEVLGVEVLHCKKVGEGIAYNAKDNYPTQCISIAGLALIKCKEWADLNCYTLLSGKDTLENNKDGDYVCFVKTQNILSYVTVLRTFGADSEAEAIFKACEWVNNEIHRNKQ